jgi:hypothetical protein
MKRTTILVTVLALLVGALALPAMATTYGTTVPGGIVPAERQGNFVAGTDQDVCYALATELGSEDWVTSELKGWKIDPPVNFENAYVKVTISANGRELAWETKDGTEMMAVIVKGGPNYNIYDYVESELIADGKLVSPLHKGKTPQISHYNLCVKPPVTTAGGCTPGFWKNDTPANRPAWAFLAGLEPPILKTSIFVDPNSFETALAQTGQNILWAHGAAAYLNASMGTYVSYPYSQAEVLELFAAGNKDALEAANELGCPLSATNPPPPVE